MLVSVPTKCVTTVCSITPPVMVPKPSRLRRSLKNQITKFKTQFEAMESTSPRSPPGITAKSPSSWTTGVSTAKKEGRSRPGRLRCHGIKKNDQCLRLYDKMRERDRETERQRDRETERQRDRETERQRDRETEILKNDRTHNVYGYKIYS